MRSKIESSLSAKVPPPLVKALLDAHAELKENFYFERFRPSELEGGRFAEACIRVVQHLATGAHDSMSKPLPPFDEDFLKKLAMPVSGQPPAHESLRLHIPRALFTIYGIRNRRDVGHIGGDVNPNQADAYLIVTVCDWILAELVRLTFNCKLMEAQAMVDDLVERSIPVIQHFGKVPKILRTGLSVPDRIMALAYVAGNGGFNTKDMQDWLKPTKNAVIMVATLRLDRNKAFLHRAGDQCFITKSGIEYVEKNKDLGAVLTK